MRRQACLCLAASKGELSTSECLKRSLDLCHRHLLSVLLLSTSLSGCGAMWVPRVGEVWDRDHAGIKLARDEQYYSGKYGLKHWAEIPGEVSSNSTMAVSPVPASARIEYEVKKKIYCDLRKAIRAADYYVLIQTDRKAKWDKEAIKDGKVRNSGIPTNWVAQVSLTFTVDENTALNPGISLITPMHNGVVNFAGEYFGTTSGVSFPGSKVGGLLSGYPATYTYGPLTGIAQSFNFELGATLSSTGTRIDKFQPLLHDRRFA